MKYLIIKVNENNYHIVVRSSYLLSNWESIYFVKADAKTKFPQKVPYLFYSKEDAESYINGDIKRLFKEYEIERSKYFKMLKRYNGYNLFNIVTKKITKFISFGLK